MFEFGIGTMVIIGFVLIWFWNSIYIIKEWERGVVLRLGRLLPQAKGRGYQPGLLAHRNAPRASACASKLSTSRRKTSSPATTSP